MSVQTPRRSGVQTLDTLSSEEARLLGFVDGTIRLLATTPSDVYIVASRVDRCLVLDVYVAAEDRGRVIGRNGQVAKSIRTVLDAYAGRVGVHYQINLARTEKENQ